MDDVSKVIFVKLTKRSIPMRRTFNTKKIGLMAMNSSLVQLNCFIALVLDKVTIKTSFNKRNRTVFFYCCSQNPRCKMVD
jgi:hypothetical protein